MSIFRPLHDTLPASHTPCRGRFSANFYRRLRFSAPYAKLEP